MGMLIWLANSTTVATAGTQVQISNTSERVLWIRFRPNEANAAGQAVYVGESDVSLTNGWSLQEPLAGKPTEELELPINREGLGSVLLSEFWVDSQTDGGIVDWVAFVSGGG